MPAPGDRARLAGEVDQALERDEVRIVNLDGIGVAVAEILGEAKTRAPGRYAIDGQLKHGDPRGRQADNDTAQVAQLHRLLLTSAGLAAAPAAARRRASGPQ